MTNASYQNGTLFITFEDGDFFITQCDRDTALEIFYLIKEGEDKETIISLLDVDYGKKVKYMEEVVKSNQTYETLEHDNFYLQDGKMYRKGIPLSIPMFLANSIRDAIINGDTETLNKLEKFWAWCSRMKSAESREGFYDFIEKNNLIITPQGFVVGFRKVRSVGKHSQELIDFVVNTYAKQKKHKKSTTISVYLDDDKYNTQEGEKVGILSELYKDITDGKLACYESVTANHLTGKTEKYYIGKETRLPDDQVDWNPHNECSRGQM